jgi:hypothetical protein
MLRRTRRQIIIHRLTDDALWIALLATVGILVATELIATIGRA